MYATYEGGNAILDRLPKAERRILFGSVHVVAVDTKSTATSAGQPFEHLVFPVDAVFAVVASFSNGGVVQASTVGAESFLPVEAVIAAPLALRSTVCRLPGTAALLHRTVFTRAMNELDVFAHVVRRNAAIRLFDAEQSRSCNLIHGALERCATWILVTGDRAGRADFSITHEFLARMIGTRRAAATEAAGQLQRIGAITYRHGKMTIADRNKLRAETCECYEIRVEAFGAALNGPTA